MSATNRGAKRSVADFYGTPAWCVHRLLEMCPLPSGGRWLEPCAGDGAIIRATNEWMRQPPKWYASDVRMDCEPALRPLAHRLWIGNHLLDCNPLAQRRYAVAITNPPFSIAWDFVWRTLPLAGFTVMLLRLNFLGSIKRHAQMQRHMPDIYVLPNRPSFTGGKTDATEYGWFVWYGQQERDHGNIVLLNLTSLKERTHDYDLST